MTTYDAYHEMPDVPISTLIDTYWTAARQTRSFENEVFSLREQITDLEAENEALRAEIATLSLPKVRVRKPPVMRRCEGHIPYTNDQCPSRFKPKSPRRKYCSTRCAMREAVRRYHARHLTPAE